MPRLQASAFYVTIKALEYETVNPEQDHSGDAEAGRAPMAKKNTNISQADTETHPPPILHRLASAGTAGTGGTVGTATNGAGDQRITLSRGSTAAVRSYGEAPILEASQA